MKGLMDKEKETKQIINIDLDDDENENNANAEPNTAPDADADLDDDNNDSTHNNSNNNNINNNNNSNNENSNTQPESNTSTTTNKKNKKITRAVKDILTSIGTKFMSNFDPELSNRERRKLTRKFNVDGKKNAAVFDDNGSLGGVDKDICDCLMEDCPGCHFPCPKCRSCKCGVECRVNRKWVYEAIENEADLVVTRNANISTN